MKRIRFILTLCILNFTCFVLIQFLIPQYLSSNLETHLDWHPNFGYLTYYYSHYLIVAQYILSISLILLLLFPTIKKKILELEFKKSSIIILSIMLIYYSTVAFFNVLKFYPSIRFPNFTTFVEKGKNTAEIAQITLFDLDGNLIDLRKELQPYEIHHFLYIKLNLIDTVTRQNTVKYLENHVLHKPIVLKVDTITYTTPK